jgi:hypothetical protein
MVKCIHSVEHSAAPSNYSSTTSGTITVPTAQILISIHSKDALHAPSCGAALAGFTGGVLNPYGEVDVIDERGYVDGVKVARKYSKANALGKAVEYVHVLKRCEIRISAEQDGLKALFCGLVGY